MAIRTVEIFYTSTKIFKYFEPLHGFKRVFYGFTLRNMNDLFLTYLKTNVVSCKDHFTENSTTSESILISIKLNTQV